MLEDETLLPPTASIATAGPTAESMLAFDHVLLQKYFENLLPLVLDADVSDLDSTLFCYPDTVDKFTRFANDAQTPVLFVLKEKEGGKDDGK